MDEGAAAVPMPPLGVFLPSLTDPGTAPPHLGEAAAAAEAHGFESVWAVDQLIAGAGAPLVDSTVALAQAAATTSVVGLGYGVMIMPLRPAVWAAREVASLQEVSGGRVLLGVGAGGDRHALSWDAAGVPRRERGARLDAALPHLRDLIAGRPVALDGRSVQLLPGAQVPPLLVGGLAEAALTRTAAHADGWFGMPLPPSELRAVVDRLGALAAERGRRPPAVTGSVVVALPGDPALPSDAELHHLLTRPDGRFGMPAAAARSAVVRDPEALAEVLGGWGELGAERVVVTVAAGDWHRQLELIAQLTPRSQPVPADPPAQSRRRASG